MRISPLYGFAPGRPFRFLTPVGSVIIGLLVVMLLPAGGAAQVYTCGDINEDGHINIGDAVSLVLYVFVWDNVYIPDEVGDVNCDGGINLGDAVYMIRHIFRFGPGPCANCSGGGQKVFFDVWFANYAWGYQMHGFYIDNDGLVYTYDHSFAPWEAPDPEAITEDQLLEKIGHNAVITGFIQLAVLEEKIALIPAAAEGPYTERAARCFDFGSIEFLAYQFNADEGVYYPVLLKLQGDWAQDNLSEEAVELYEWLTTVAPGWDIEFCAY